MQPSPSERVQTILELALDPDLGARPAAELLPILYEELRALARSRLAREPAGGTLQATALVHEAWMRLVGDADPGWSGRGHFFGAAARAMQRILVERARARSREKRSGGERITLHSDLAAEREPEVDLIALDEALDALQRMDARKAEVVRLRHFCGLGHEEIAAVLGVSEATVKNEWAFARAWLRRALAEPGAAADGERGA